MELLVEELTTLKSNQVRDSLANLTTRLGLVLVELKVQNDLLVKLNRNLEENNRLLNRGGL